MSLPDKYSHLDVETRWMLEWEARGVFRWDESATRDDLFVVDTPPPTVSGSLHLGHVFSYTQTDLIVRFQRMRGKKIFYPMGWDDNGLPTERRVQNKYGIRCNPTLPFQSGWEPTDAGDRKDPIEVSRQNFIDACAILTEADETVFEDLWRRLSLSVDWKQTYATISKHSIKISQLSFLDLVKKGYLYQAESPTMWDVDFKSALAQADLEDRPKQGAFHEIRFEVEGGGEFVIATTRPELLASCISVVAHPSDTRYQPFFGKNAITPLFEAAVPIVPAEHADPEKGTGIMMVCTFGDNQDVEWWKKSHLPAKAVISPEGRILPVDFTKAPFLSRAPERAASFWASLQGLKVEQARRKIAELLATEGSGVGGVGRALVGEPKPVEQMVKYYEKGDRPIEFITTRQWFVKLLDFKKEFIEQGRKITWHPEHMRARYENWVDGLMHDWCISRQRYFGVPFPVWYPIDQNGVTQYEKPIFAESLPCDPLNDIPPGYTASQRGQAGGFQGDPDVMDTWATSSVCPQLMSHWGIDENRHSKLFPMDIRPQGHDIIRTWAFYTIAKAWMHSKEIPWKHIVLSGWILDPDRKKMSKSKGNVVTPGHLLEQYSSDAVRYWAARARLGVDTAFDEKVLKVGQKLSTKIFNASKFVLMQCDQVLEGKPSPGTEAITRPLDLAFVDSLGAAVEEATAAFAEFDYAQALQVTETAFWDFCDNYVELVKARAYSGDNAGKLSAVATLSWALKTFLRLLAPIMPYITEEVWSWRFAKETGNSSVHLAPWPTTGELTNRGDKKLLTLVSAAVSEVRSAKSSQQKSLGATLSSLTIFGGKDSLSGLSIVLDDLCGASRVSVSDTILTEGIPPGEKIFSTEVSFAE